MDEPREPAFWDPPPGWPRTPGYPRNHPGVHPDDALEVLPPGTQESNPGLWSASRLTGIGASDVSALLGLNRRTAAMEVYEEKVEGLPMPSWDDDDDGDGFGEEAEWGTLHEPVVRDRYARRTGLRIVKPGTFRSVRWPWLVVNPDGLVVNPDGRWPAADGTGRAEGYEGKCASIYVAPKWAHGMVPDHAELQCQTVMAVLGLDGMHVACLIGGQRAVHRYVTRDDELISDIVEVTREFWFDHVMTRTPPPPDGGPACAEFLIRKYPHAHAGSTATAEAAQAAFIRAAYLQEKAAKTYAAGGALGKNTARDLIGDTEALVDEQGQVVATWRHTGKLREQALLAAHPDETRPFLIKQEVFDEAAFADAHPELHAAFRARVLLIKTTTPREHPDG